MMLGSRNHGKVPNDSEYMKAVGHISECDFNPLIQVGFLEPVANASTVKANGCAIDRGETETYRDSVTKVTASSQQEALKKQVWQEGKAVAPASVIGKLIDHTDGDHTEALKLIQQAATKSQPKPWLLAVMQKKQCPQWFRLPDNEVLKWARDLGVTTAGKQNDRLHADLTGAWRRENGGGV